MRFEVRAVPAAIFRKKEFMKTLHAKTVPAALAAAALCTLAAAANAETPADGAPESKPYNPVEALREASAERSRGNGSAAAGARRDEERRRFALPEKSRSDGLSFLFAAEYFFDFGSDFHGGDGAGGSLAADIHINSDSPNWDFLCELELLAFSAESGRYTHRGYRVKDSIDSANLIFNFGLSRRIADDFSVDGMLGIGLGLTYDEVKGGGYDSSESGNWTMVFGAKLRGDYRLSEHWSVFAAYRLAYISPSFVSKIAGWHNLDLISQSVELGLRLRF